MEENPSLMESVVFDGAHPTTPVVAGLQEIAIESNREDSPPASLSMESSSPERLRTQTVNLNEDDGTSSFQISVTDPEKQGEGMNAFVSYKVQTKTSLSHFKEKELVVIRRYKDFDWLHDQLSEQHKNCIIPPTPDKVIMTNRFTPEFLEYRRKELERFLRRVAAHPVLRLSPIFQTFLEADDEKLNAAKTTKSDSGIMASFFKVTVSGISNSVASLNLNNIEEEDPWFTQKVAYINNLGIQFNSLATISSKLVSRRRELVDTMTELSLALTGLAYTEDTPEQGNKSLQEGFDQLSQVTQQIANLNKELGDAEAISFEDSIKDYCRIISAVKTLLNYRTEALGHYQLASKNHASKMDKLLTAKGSSAKLAKEVEEAKQLLEGRKESFEKISKECKVELERFDSDKEKDIKASLTKFIQVNMELELRINDLWKRVFDRIAGSWRL